MGERSGSLGLVPFFIQQVTDDSVIEERLGRIRSVQRSKRNADWLIVDTKPNPDVP